MVRYAFALRGDTIDPAHEIVLEEQQVDIVHRLDQITEHFLCDINAKGEVPVLEPLGSGKPLEDSVAITKYLANSYPSMIPKSHEKEIVQMIEDLHAINFFGFTFQGKSGHTVAMKSYLNDLLDGQISDRYRAAIIYKLKRVETTKAAALTPEAQQANEQYAVRLMARMECLLKDSKTGYLFGLQKPSALDAHLVVFIARMLDIGRGDVLPASIRSYGENAMKGTVWKNVMQGRTTNVQS